MVDRVAVVLAGGVGTRMGLDLPKQLIRVGGRTLLEHSIAAFDSHPDVDRVLVMMVASHLDQARAIASTYPKVEQVLPGAETRSATTQRALEAVGADETQVLLHDAVRPLVTARIITDAYAALEEYDAVNTAVPTSDTIIEVERRGGREEIVHAPIRSRLRRVQTPQGFRAGTLRRAYAAAVADPEFEATDDCGVVLRYLSEVPVAVIAGDEINLKVTEPTDVHLAERLLQLAAEGKDPREAIAELGDHPA